MKNSDYILLGFLIVLLHYGVSIYQERQATINNLEQTVEQLDQLKEYIKGVESTLDKLN